MDGAFCGFAQVGLKLGKGLLDGIEVRTVGRQIEQARAGRLDHLAHGRILVAGQVVHDHDVSEAEFGHEHLVDIGVECVAVDRPVEHHRCDHACAAQAGDEGGGLPVPVRYASAQTFAASAAAVPTSHVGGGPCLVDEHQSLRVEIELAFKPVPAAAQDVRTVLLAGMGGLFLRVIP